MCLSSKESLDCEHTAWDWEPGWVWGHCGALLPHLTKAFQNGKRHGRLCRPRLSLTWQCHDGLSCHWSKAAKLLTYMFVTETLKPQRKGFLLTFIPGPPLLAPWPCLSGVYAVLLQWIGMGRLSPSSAQSPNNSWVWLCHLFSWTKNMFHFKDGH